jgi:5-formyltetrahydrofolate cyclo-ligase
VACAGKEDKKVIPGVGFSELLVIAVLVLLFFGSKELPMFMREAGKLFRKAREYTDTVRRELEQITRETDPIPSFSQEVTDKKKTLRKRFSEARKALTDEERQAKSAIIMENLLNDETVKKAQSIMLYVSTPTEVQTRDLITKLYAMGKRMVFPFCRVNARTLGIASVTDFEKQMAAGEFKVLEPLEEIRDNFFKSDLHLIICPGVGFDINGARLGRGKAFYDNFLRELKGKIPIWGLSFDCQICQERFPFDYHDVAMDQVMTESGLLIKPVE